MKLDPNASRKAQRSAVASPYARTTQKKPQKEVSALPSSGSFSSLFSFITAPFRSKKRDEEDARPPLSARDSEAEVAAILPTDSDSEPEDEGMDVFGPSTSMNPAERLAMRGHELAHESVSPPVFERPILSTPRNDSRHPNYYASKPPTLPPNSPPVQFTTGRSPTPLEDAQASIEQLQGSMRHDKMNVVSNFINQKLASNQPLSKIEAYGLRALIDESVDNGVKPLAATPSRSFGFSSPSTPIRSSQSESAIPRSDVNGMAQSYTLPDLTNGGPRIPVMNKNPNPPLVYRGAGRSAHRVPRGNTPAASGSNGQSRPKPVRYRSSKFGASGAGVPPEPAQPAANQQQATPDAKRRRLDEDNDVSNSKGSPAKPVTNETNSTELATPARQRPLFGIGPATTNMPTKPSPLRQSMRPDSPGSPGSPGSSPQVGGKGLQRSSPQGSPLVREVLPTVEESPVRTRSFDVLSQVIANNTPKKPDLPAVQNPYEASSPFRTTRRAAARKVAAPAKPAAPEKTPEPVEKKQLSVLELIEKTAPASMKKTPRPKSPSPPRLVPTPSPAPTPAPSFARSSYAPSPSVNLAKAARTNGFKPAKEDAMDESEDQSDKTNVGGSLFARIGAKTPEPVDETINLIDDDEEEKAGEGEEEDELEEEEVDGGDEVEEIVMDTNSASTFATAGDRAISPTLLRDPYRAKEPSPLRQSFQPKLDSPPETPKAGSPRVRATELDDAKLPTFTFELPKAAAVESAFDVATTQAAKYKAANAAVSALPTFTFGAGMASTSSAATSAFSIAPPPASAAAPASTTSFNWAAAGIKPPTSSTTKWTCGVCMISNDAALAKCAACEEPRPASANDTSAPKTNGFDWAAAGIKPPAASTSKWDCSVCMIANDVSLQQCAACESPRPGAAPSAPPVSAFNWGAAGFKPPAAATDEWTCTMCACKSPASAKQCVVCETPK